MTVTDGRPRRDRIRPHCEGLREGGRAALEWTGAWSCAAGAAAASGACPAPAPVCRCHPRVDRPREYRLFCCAVAAVCLIPCKSKITGDRTSAFSFRVREQPDDGGARLVKTQRLLCAKPKSDRRQQATAWLLLILIKHRGKRIER